MTAQGPAEIPPKDEPPRVIRIEPSPGLLTLLILLIAGLWVLNRLLPVVLVLVAALVIVGTISPAVRWLEERRMRRGLGIAHRVHRPPGTHRSRHHPDDSLTHGAGDGPSGPGTRPAGARWRMVGGFPPDQPLGGTASQRALRRSCKDGRLECPSSLTRTVSRSSRIS